MTISRRNVLIAGATTVGLSTAKFASPSWQFAAGSKDQTVHSITPVTGDGKFIWNEQPTEEPGPVVDGQEFDVSVGIRWRSAGDAREVKSTTVAPVAFPEQEILNVEIEKSDGCEARLVQLSETAGQLQVYAPTLARDQVVEAVAKYRMKLYRFCPQYQKDQFPKDQTVTKAIRDHALGNSPGIRCDFSALKEIANSIASRHAHPWEKAENFHAWVWENIAGIPGKYTSVRDAIKTRKGDCEERAGVFIAMCRAVGIPARLVWVPNHSWAEFCLFDHDGMAHWIPAHTAAYSWFGWTGIQELVLQKGDRIHQVGRDAVVRLVADWYSFGGRKPAIEFTASLTPVTTDTQAAGPGKRQKNKNGGWDLLDTHPGDKHLRG